MSRHSRDPKLRKLANQLGLNASGDCAEVLRHYAVDRVHSWTSKLPVDSADKLLDLVAGLLSLRIHFVKDDSDIPQLTEQFGQSWPELRAQLRAEFLGSDTLGLLLAHPDPDFGSHRFYAFIDGRAERNYKAYFTAWHEVAHLLLQPPQLSFAGFRRLTDVTSTNDPLEALVDEIAGELALYAPFAAPELNRELNQVGQLTLNGIKRIRDIVAPDASFSAAAHSLVRLSKSPIAFLVAKQALKPTEMRRANVDVSDGTAIDRRPEPKLRVASVFPNELAKAAGFAIFKHMRVPQTSVLSAVHSGLVFGTETGQQDQSEWESGGENLPPLPFNIEASKFGSVIYSLVTCLPNT